MWVEAQVTSIQLRSTPRGERFYAVFKAVDGREIGIWTRGAPQLRNLQLGDTVILEKNPFGRLCMAPLPLSYVARGVLMLRKRWSRLVSS